MKPFDLTTCRSKLEGHYLKTSTVPTSVWCKKAVVDIHQIYTRLSFVKDPEKTPVETTQSEPTSFLRFSPTHPTQREFSLSRSVGRVGENPRNKVESKLNHYSDLFTANKNGVIPKRILVQGQTGIGKSTFVKKLLVDWIEVNEGNGDEQAAVLKNFELVVAVNLKEVSKCQSLVDVIRKSNVFAKEDKYMTEGLVDYISNNQEKVLLIFDGYDEYRMGCNSEIYEIFHGNSLRSCCVLITTRISKADELRGSEDLHAEITGFSEVDRKTFMRRFLKSEDVSELEDHLNEKDLDQLAKVPLLLLFFCILWKKGKSKSFPESKTKLYVDIVQFILNHSYSRQTADKTKPKQYVELKSFKEILCEIGKVALQSLLKDDHLFEYSQLSDSVCLGESVFIGLLQITEYSENLRPVGLVSFIHKSIQEFLAAWYVTYRRIPEGGNLAEIGEKFEECMALENVFLFLCGLSQDGALATFRYLKSVRMLDPSLDLSKTVPEEESETDRPLSDVTDFQRKFSDLVSNAFEEVELKAELSRACLDSLGSILLVSESFPDYLLVDAIDTNSWSLVSNRSHWYFEHGQATISRLYEIVKKLITDSSEPLRVAEFLKKFLHSYDRGCLTCGFSFVLCFRNGQVHFYITGLTDACENHSKLITDNAVSSHSVRQSSGQLSLEFLKTLECYYIEHSMKSLGAAIKNCNYLEHLEFSWSSNYVSHVLKNVLNPRKCSLSITFCSLTAKEAVELASLLPKFELVIRLSLYLADCSAEAVTRLVASIKHKTLKELELSEMNLTTAAAESLGQSLPELSALQTLTISDVTLSSAEAGTRLFAGIKHKTLEKLKLSEINLTTAAAESLGQSLPELSALQTLEIGGLTLCSAEAGTRLFAGIKHKTLEELELSGLHLTTAAAQSLGQSLPELSALQTLRISDVTLCSAEAGTRLFAGIKHKTLETLELSEINLTTAAAQSLGQSLPELSALQTLRISDVTLCSAEAGTKLFAGIKHKTLEDLELSEINLTTAAAESLGQSLPELSALQALEIGGLSLCSAEATTRLFAAIKHKTLETLALSELYLTTAAAQSLGQSLPELSALQTLRISDVTLCSAEAGTKLFAGIKHKTLEEMELSGMNLTSAAAVALGQSLPELPSLQRLAISGSDGCSLQLEFLVLPELKIYDWPEFSAELVTRLIAVIKQKPIKKLELTKIHLTSAVAEALGQLLRQLSALKTLRISGLVKCSDDAVTKLVSAIKHKTLEELELFVMNLTSTVAESLAQSLPELSALRTLRVSGLIECSDEAVTKLVTAIKHKTLEELELSKINLTSAVAGALGQSLPELSALRTLRVSGLIECSDEAVTKLVTAIRHKTLEKLELSKINLTSAVAGALGQWLPELSALKILKISCLRDCSDEALTRLLATIKHKTLEILQLSEMNLTSAAVVALCQSLPELPSLKILKISGSGGCSLQLDFSLLRELEINGWPEFSAEAVTRLIAVIKHKPIEKLELSKIHLTSAMTEALGQLLTELPALKTLRINGLTECSDEKVTKLVSAIKHNTLEELKLSEIHLTSVVAEALGQSLPELSALRTLKLIGLDECRLQHKEVEALFGRFSRPSSLKQLWVNGFTARGSLAPLAKNLCLFPCLKVLDLDDLDMDEADLSGLLENLKFTPNLRSLHLGGNPVGHAVRSMIPYLFEQQKLEEVYFQTEDCSEKNLKYVQEAVKEKRPRLNIKTSWW